MTNMYQSAQMRKHQTFLSVIYHLSLVYISADLSLHIIHYFALEEGAVPHDTNNMRRGLRSLPN